MQCYSIGLLNSTLQGYFSRNKPGTGTQQWSLSYILGCALATITIYCNCFGEQLWKSSPCWVCAAAQSCYRMILMSISLRFLC